MIWCLKVCAWLALQVPSLCEDLLSSVDQPLKISRDKATGKDYLLCDYNRDGDSYRYIPCLSSPPPSLSLSLFLFCLLLSTLVPYWCLMNMYTKHLFTTLSIELCSVIHPKYTCRSPWSNKYDPPLPDGAVPSDRLRRLEVEANQAFDTYREL